VNFVPLRVATPWSFHWGASRLADLTQHAAEVGYEAMGMADFGGLWGAVPFQKACDAAGIRPIFGVRLQEDCGREVQVVAEDASGWAALCRLSTRGFKEGFGRLERWLEEEDEGFFVLAEEPNLLATLKQSLGKERVFVRVRPGWRVGQGLDLCDKLGLHGVAAPTVAFAHLSDYQRHRLLVAIGSRTNLARLEQSSAGARLATPSAGLQSHVYWQTAYADAPQCLARAGDLAERSQFRIPLGKPRRPRMATPYGRSSQAHLARLCERGKRRRRVEWTLVYERQLRRELALIGEQDMTDYFLLVAEIVRWCRTQGIRNCGRGSAANSLVAWLLGLTHVDPVVHGLWFDRFMNPGRLDFPDVDLDFAWDERDRVVDYVYQRFGRQRVAMIGTHHTFAARSAVRELAKAMGVPAGEISPVTRALPWHGGQSWSLESLRADPKAARLSLDAEPWRTVLRQALSLEGFPRHMGVHPGGVVVAPSPLTDHLPLQPAKKTISSGPVIVTQWDMGPVEEAGLLKVDLLGNRGLAVVRDAARAVKRNTGLQVDFDHLDPRRDTRTQKALAQGDSMGCFYIESPGMRSLLRKLQCRDFSTLVAASSIIRPGISYSGMMRAYIERFHLVREKGQHQDDWYLDFRLRPLLEETYGVLTYQEDVLQVAQVLAGMSAEQADGLRRAMTRKNSWKKMSEWHQDFVGGLTKFGMPSAPAEELWRQIESFAGYSFCKAHSASYAVLSFQSVWLRSHYPAEFMAAVLRNEGGFYDPLAYLAEARRMGLKLLAPCVQTGGLNYQGHGGTLRVGLAGVRGLSLQTSRRILLQRATCPQAHFKDFHDFIQRLNPRPVELQSLVRAGACDALDSTKTRADLMRWVALYQRRRSPTSQTTGLFPDAAIPEPPPVEEFSFDRILELEVESLGFPVSAHPLHRYRREIQACAAMPANRLSECVNQRVRLVGWQVTRKPIRTRKGEPMLFLSFEDTTALYETVLFPKAYRKLAPLTLTRGPYLVEGTVRMEHDDFVVDVQNLQLLGQA